MENLAFAPSNVAGKDYSSICHLVREELFVSAIPVFLATKGNRWDQFIDLKEFSDAIQNLDLGARNDILQNEWRLNPGSFAKQMTAWRREAYINYSHGHQTSFMVTKKLITEYY